MTTRDPGAKTQVQFIRKMSWTLISGVIIGMIINMVLLPMWLEKDIHGYALLMISLSVVAIPLLLLEYFYTRERITEDIATEYGVEHENSIPLREQMKALFTNKYFVILTIIATVSGIVDNFKGGNVQYFYIKFLLGGAENPMMYTIYQIATGIPTGLGAIIAYPIAKKVGIRNMTLAGYALLLIGSVIGWMFPDQLVPADCSVTSVGSRMRIFLQRFCALRSTAWNLSPTCGWKAFWAWQSLRRYRRRSTRRLRAVLNPRSCGSALWTSRASCQARKSSGL